MHPFIHIYHFVVSFTYFLFMQADLIIIKMRITENGTRNQSTSKLRASMYICLSISFSFFLWLNQIQYLDKLLFEWEKKMLNIEKTKSPATKIVRTLQQFYWIEFNWYEQCFISSTLLPFVLNLLNCSPLKYVIKWYLAQKNVD